MIYLSGCVHPAVIEIPNTGYMLTPMMGNRPDLTGLTWAADTGCFSRPEAHDLENYLTWLARWEGKGRCLFATAPDRYGDPAATLEVALPEMPLIRAAGHRVAFVAQPGAWDLPVPWEAFDALFIGGPDEGRFCPEMELMVAEAKRRGKWVHMGRVNSWRRVRYAQVIGCDSTDGTFVAFGPEVNIPKLRRWMGHANAGRQLRLGLEG